jgi:TPR repeat protein
MIAKRRLLILAAGTMLAAAPAAAQDVRAGIEAWESERYDEAVRNWRPLADRGDPDAQFNLGHAYRLGRGVPRNMTLAEQWYERAARAGHVEAQAMYGLILFQNGRRQEAMPYVQRAAERGDARAQYVYGTALFNGDVVARDWPRAYAFMSRAASQGFPPAQSHLQEMEQHIPAEDRARGAELANSLASQTLDRTAAAAPPLVAPPPRVASTSVPPSTVSTEVPPAPRPTQVVAVPSGRWRVQLGAFSSEANARRAWSQVAGRLSGLQPFYVRAGAMTRLQAGPLASRAAAERACASAGQACFPVSP